MEAQQLVQRLRRLDGEEILSLAATLRHHTDTPEGEVAWWRASMSVGAALKAHHCTRHAAMAAHRAAEAVVSAAQRAGMDETHRDEVTLVARAAADAARALVLERDIPQECDAVLAPWLPVVAA